MKIDAASVCPKPMKASHLKPKPALQSSQHQDSVSLSGGGDSKSFAKLALKGAIGATIGYGMGSAMSQGGFGGATVGLISGTIGVGAAATPLGNGKGGGGLIYPLGGAAIGAVGGTIIGAMGVPYTNIIGAVIGGAAAIGLSA